MPEGTEYPISDQRPATVAPDLLSVSIAVPENHQIQPDSKDSVQTRSARTENLFSFAQFEEQYLWWNISHAEGKAGLTLAAIAALFGYLLSAGMLSAVVRSPIEWRAGEFAAAGAIILLSAAFLRVLVVVMPKTQGSSTGTVFWGAISSRENRETYISDVERMDDSARNREILGHCFELAGIARRKFAVMRSGIMIALFGLVFALVFLTVHKLK